MARPPEDAKVQALRQYGALNPHAGAVSDPLFHANPFFDARDLIQVRYEMVRRHTVDGLPVSAAAGLGTGPTPRLRGARLPGLR